MAKKFSFRLEPVLNLKSFRAKQAKEELNLIVKLRQDKEKHIEDNYSYLSLLLKDSKTGNIKAENLQTMWAHIDFVEREIKKLEKELQQLLEIEALKREILTQAMKEEKILDKLKEKKKMLHNEELNAEERKFLDEIGLKIKPALDFEQN